MKTFAAGKSADRVSDRLANLQFREIVRPSIKSKDRTRTGPCAELPREQKRRRGISLAVYGKYLSDEFVFDV